MNRFSLRLALLLFLSSLTASCSPHRAGIPGVVASKERPFVNSLGMKFVPVAGTKVLFSVWETRVQDYQVFATETRREWPDPRFEKEPTHPAVMVSWDDAVAFCAWLSKKEGRTYRLPTDAEWSLAVGLGKEEGRTPGEKQGEAAGYPWGKAWPPPAGAGNYSHRLKVDDFLCTAPVGSFAADRNGIHDLGGNVWEWCEDKHDGEGIARVIRGGSFFTDDEPQLLASCRFDILPTSRRDEQGFRCVLVLPGG